MNQSDQFLLRCVERYKLKLVDMREAELTVLEFLRRELRFQQTTMVCTNCQFSGTHQEYSFHTASVLTRLLIDGCLDVVCRLHRARNCQHETCLQLHGDLMAMMVVNLVSR